MLLFGKKKSKTERKEKPFPPLITSTCSKEASNNWGFSAKKTMSLASGFTKGWKSGREVDGLIT